MTAKRLLASCIMDFQPPFGAVFLWQMAIVNSRTRAINPVVTVSCDYIF
jgi:hypothetical protein